MAAPGQTTASNPNVAELQRVLAAYANATGYTPANPGPADGIVGTRTIMAVVSVAPRIPGLPSDIRALIPLAGILLATSEGQAKAKDLITKNASSITKALLAVAALSIASGGTPGASTPTSPGSVIPFPIGPTKLPGGGGAGAIWYYDSKHGIYHVAIPRGLQGLGTAPYVEVASSMTPPAGTQVDKSTFLTQTGQWYKTTWGIATLVGAGSVGIGSVGYALSRLFRR
jgi:hypothetical protein